MKRILLLLGMSLLIFNSCNTDDENPITPPSETVPTLSSPSDGASNVAFPIKLTWNTFPGATSYTLQVSIDSYFTSYVFNQSGLTSTTQQISGLSDSTKYYWRVSADNSSGASNAWSFSSAATGGSVPDKPILLTPINLSTNQSTSPTLSWNLSSGATSYTLEVSKTSLFSTIIYYQSGITATNYQLTGLDDSTGYYWRVSASNKNGTSGNSTHWLFATSGLGTPGNPSLVSPSNGATDIPTPVTLTWNASFGATSYTLQVSDNSTFSTVLLNYNSSTTSREVTGLNYSTTYYWRVRATNTFGTSSHSNTWSFTTNDGKPGIPTLLSPSDGAVNEPISPTLSWNSSAGATSYTLQVSESNLFTSFAYNQSGLLTTSLQIDDLSGSKTYYWRVSATNAKGASSWSSLWSFKTVIMNIACPGIPSVTYAGKTYNTVQIANQCWLMENLDVGTRLNGSENASNNGTIEKYCYNDDPANCTVYGGLYQWNEAMAYSTSPGTQGICPTGWHIPTLSESDALKKAVSYNGNALKSIGQGSGSGAGTNTSGFSALLTGVRTEWGGFFDLSKFTFIWISLENGSNNAYALYLVDWTHSNFYYETFKTLGSSVRCVKD